MTFRGACAALVAAGLGVAAVFAGCKTKESLVLVTVETAAGDTTLKTLTISVGTHAQTFALAEGVGVPADPGVTYGVYVPSSLTGKQTVSVVAEPLAGNCNGATGTSHVSIGTVGEVDGPVLILLAPANVCSGLGGSPGTAGSTGTGGAAGMAGSTGAAGTGGAAGTTGLAGNGGAGTGGLGGRGGTGTGGGPATGITACTEYDHGATGQCANTACTGDYAVWGTAFSPSNPNLAVTSGTDGRAKVWTVNSSGVLSAEGHVVTGGTGFGVMAFSPDGTLLAIGGDGGVRIVNTSTWTVTRTLTVATTVYGVAFSPDGTQVITLDTDVTPTPTASHLYVHAVTNPAALHSVALNDGYALGVSHVAMSGGVLVAVTTLNGTALVYNLTSAGFSMPTTLTVTSDASVAETAEFSPNGTLLAAGGDDGLLQFWPVPPTGTPQAPAINVVTGTAAGSAVYFVAFSPATAELAVGTGYAGSVTTYSTTSRTKVGVEQDTSNGYDVVSLGYSPNGKYIIGGEFNCGCIFLCQH